MTQQVIVKDVIEAVVTSMKSSGSIISVSNIETTYTLVVEDTGNLFIDSKVLIGTNYYRVAYVDTVFKSFFTVVSTTEITDSMTWEMYINYVFESTINCADYISNQGQQKKEDQKFDLIWLHKEIREISEKENNKIDKRVDILMVLATDSIIEYSTEERFENKIEPRLYPLYDLFIKTLSNSDSIILNANERLQDDKKDQPNYATTGKDPKDILNQITDAIEFKITDLKIKKIFTNNC